MGPAVPHHPLSAPPDGPGAAARREARRGLYLHVPFCATRCAYCDFSSGALSSAAVERWLSGIELEAARRAPAAAGPFHSVFFGGGTPSALSARHFARVMRALRGAFEIAADAEITLEANPESVRPALLEAWLAGGVNRLSFGAQSFVPEELAALGRIHDAGRPAAAVAMARAAGVRRLSVDLMFGFPGHTAARWDETLSRAIELDVEHLSAYCFIPEPGTPLGNEVIAGRAALPPADEQAATYAVLSARLGDAGYGCYETSNFSRPGAECRHNLVYWLRRPYLALGPSAHGFLAGERYANHYALEAWAADLERGGSGEVSREVVDEARACEETVMLALRLGRGLDLAEVAPELRGALDRRVRPALAAAVAAGRLRGGGDRWWIPEAHRFVADDVIAWVAARAEVDSPFASSVP